MIRNGTIEDGVLEFSSPAPVGEQDLVPAAASKLAA